MANSRGITTFILTLGFTALIITACETQPERERGGAAPSPTVGVTPSPTGTASPYASPTGSPVALTTSEKEFMSNAARGGMLEVQLGNLAAQKASSNDVKQFGERMATDHGQLGQKLQQLASNLNVTLPQDLKPEQQAIVSRFEKLTGKAFDRDFMKEMVSDHTKDISEFERAASQATNPDIKQFASEALPTLREHLKMAREIAGKLH
jgi:putative membrane protein